MKKNILIGLGVGLAGYYFFIKTRKKPCNCQDEKSEKQE